MRKYYGAAGGTASHTCRTSECEADYLIAGRIALIQLGQIIFAHAWPIYASTRLGVTPHESWRIQMKILIRAALTAISLATIPPVANAAASNNAAPVVQQDSTTAWTNG
jgi:hypothetical protein